MLPVECFFLFPAAFFLLYLWCFSWAHYSSTLMTSHNISPAVTEHETALKPMHQEVKHLEEDR